MFRQRELVRVSEIGVPPFVLVERDNVTDHGAATKDFPL
jgi:hypothetical protein